MKASTALASLVDFRLITFEVGAEQFQQKTGLDTPMVWSNLFFRGLFRSTPHPGCQSPPGLLHF